MKTNAILEEVRAIKEELDREAGGDLATFCAQAREWGATNPLPGPLVQPEDVVEYFKRLDAEAGPGEIDASDGKDFDEPGADQRGRSAGLSAPYATTS